MDPQDATFWAIEHLRSPSPEGESGGLLCMPLPWGEGETIRAALMIYESRVLAEEGLKHYLARTEQNPHSYGVLALSAEDLVEILEGRPEGFERVAINPILSRYFPDGEGYSAGFGMEDFVDDLKKLAGIDNYG
jgi:hypothetical protein